MITGSEIMVSVTGVEWAYTEAPPSMKARDPLTIGRRTSSADGLRSIIRTMRCPIGQFIPYYSNCQCTLGYDNMHWKSYWFDYHLYKGNFDWNMKNCTTRGTNRVPYVPILIFQTVPIVTLYSPLLANHGRLIQEIFRDPESGSWARTYYWNTLPNIIFRLNALFWISVPKIDLC